MAATPTEVLNDDIRELKGDIRENRAKIDLVKEEVQRLAIAQAEMKVELRDDIHRIALSQAEMKGEFRLLKVLLTLVIATIAGAAWQFFNLDAKVNGVESRLDRFDSRFERIESRLEKLETSIGKILDQTRPPAAPQVSKGSTPSP